MQVFKIVVWITFICFSISGNSQNWNIIEFGPCPVDKVWGVKIANGRNDGLNRIYVSANRGSVYEWLYEDGEWKMDELPFQTQAKLVPICSGKLHADSLERLYFAEWMDKGGVFEAFFQNGEWKITEIGRNPKSNTGIIVGDARNDGQVRLYVAGFYGIKEYGLVDGVWEETDVYAGTVEGMGQIGKASHSNAAVLYGNGDFIYENVWNGNSFENHPISSEIKWPESLVIGKARNDGVNRIYAKTSLGRIEISFEEGNWTYEVLNNSTQRGAIITGITQSDGLERVYSNFTKAWKVPDSGPLYQYTWDGEKYDQEMIVDGISGATGMIEIGDGRNDGTNRIYVPHFDTGGIYEITHADSFRVIPNEVLELKLKKLKLKQNIVRDYIEFGFSNQIKQAYWVRIFDVHGRQKASFQSNDNQVQADVSKLTNGFYILKVDGFYAEKFQIKR